MRTTKLSNGSCYRRDEGFPTISFNTIKFKCLKITQMVCGLTSLIAFFNNLEGSNEGDHEGAFTHSSSMNPNSTITRSIVATNPYQMTLLLIGRFIGFWMYPVLILVIFTKYRATQAFLNKTSFSVFLIQNRHALHVYSGWCILIGSIIHSFCHSLRWVNQGTISLLVTNKSGVTGLIVIISTCLIVIPMAALKKKLKYETRKRTHYLFWVFYIAMIFHVPIWRLPRAGYCSVLFPVLISWYFLDAMYVKLFMSERIDTVNYKVLKGGIELTMMVSKRFEKNIKGGYGYIMAPWVSKCQWHPLSIYEDPHDSRRRHMFIAKVGDWTTNLYEKVATATSARPLWISGPFPSPYNDCLNFDNMICVGLGVGITPALSTIANYKDSRRCNLIWVVRDVSMLVFFLENTELDHKAINLIFYTGEEPLSETIRSNNILHDAHVQVIEGRPDIRRLIPNLINYFENPKSDFNMKNMIDLGLNSAHCVDTEGSSTTGHSSSLTTEDRPRTVAEDNDSNLPFGFASACGVSSKDDVDCTTKTCESLDIEKCSMSHKSTEVLDSQSKTFAQPPSRPVFRRPNSPPLVPVYRRENHKIVSIDEPGSITEKGDNIDVHTLSDSDESKIGEIGLWNKDLKLWEENTDAIDYLRNDFPKIRRDTWGILYCGRRNELRQCLKRECINLQIPLHEEVFDW